MTGQAVTMENIGERITKFGLYLDNPFLDTRVNFYNHPRHDWLLVSVYPNYRGGKILVSIDDCDANGGNFNIIVGSMDGFDEEFKRALGAIKLGRL